MDSKKFMNFSMNNDNASEIIDKLVSSAGAETAAEGYVIGALDSASIMNEVVKVEKSKSFWKGWFGCGVATLGCVIILEKLEEKYKWVEKVDDKTKEIKEKINSKFGRNCD